MAANRSIGDTLHAEFAEYLLLLLRNALDYQRGDQAKFDLDAATMGVIRAFLKDSEITFAPAEKRVLNELRTRFNKERAEAVQSLVSSDFDDVGMTVQ